MADQPQTVAAASAAAMTMQKHGYFRTVINDETDGLLEMFNGKVNGTVLPTGGYQYQVQTRIPMNYGASGETGVLMGKDTTASQLEYTGKTAAQQLVTKAADYNG